MSGTYQPYSKTVLGFKALILPPALVLASALVLSFELSEESTSMTEALFKCLVVILVDVVLSELAMLFNNFQVRRELSREEKNKERLVRVIDSGNLSTKDLKTANESLSKVNQRIIALCSR